MMTNQMNEKRFVRMSSVQSMPTGVRMGAVSMAVLNVMGISTVWMEVMSSQNFVQVRGFPNASESIETRNFRNFC